MNKRDIAVTVAETAKVSQIDAKKIVQATFDTISDVLAEQGRLELRNFGVFIVKTRKPRKARNPRTGESVMVPSRRTVTFKPGLEMLKKIKK
jgi:integration host factor subunit beta